MEYRIDRGIGLRRARRTDDGRLIADAFLTRTGVFTYLRPDGSVRKEYRSPEEVFHADAMNSFSMVPVTHEHPPEPFSAAVARRYMVGSVGEQLRRVDDKLAAPLAVNDADTIRAMDGGKCEVSCGYTIDLDETPGTAPNGERYDAVQRRIRGNHVAIVDGARAGSDIRVRMDSGTQFACQVTPCYTEDSMAKPVDKTKSTPAPDEAKLVLERLDSAETRADAAEKRATGAESRADAAEGQVEELRRKVTELTERLDAADEDKLRATVDDLTAKLTAETARADTAEDPARFEGAVNARVALLATASQVLPDGRFDGMSNHDVRIACLEKLGSAVDPARADSADYVAGKFEIATERYAAQSAALERVRDLARDDAAAPRNDSRTRRERYADEQRKRGTAPLTQESK
jgi:hypothetical protein